MGTSLIRVVLAIGCVVVALGGLVGAASGLGFPALWLTISACVALVALAVEKMRYRSEASDALLEPIGPGGGEPGGALEPRFRRTDETFVDPTTGHVMRVHVDPRTGERRYLAEG